MSITHKRHVNRVDDNADPNMVHPSDWNDVHVVEGLIGVLLELAAAPDAFPYIGTDGAPGMAALSPPARAFLACATKSLMLAAIDGAPLNNAALTGEPTAPTAPLGTNTSRIATMAALRQMRDDLINAAPGALDTLREFAEAIGNDPSFAATIAASLGNRLRFDATQSLSAAQKAQAIQNLALAAIAVSGAYSDLSGRPTLGTAAALNVGMAANNVPQLDPAGKLPAIDGSQLTNLPTAGVRYDGVQSLTSAQRQLARQNIGAAPLDALAYSGMQINGAMEVAQESGAAVQTITATSSLVYKYVLDGIMIAARGTFVATAQQVAAPSGMVAAKALKIAISIAQASLGANDELSIVLPIEGLRTSRLLMGTAQASPQSLGFWFSSQRVGQYSGSIMNAARTRCYPIAFTVTAAGVPQWISFGRETSNEILADASGVWLNDTNVGQYITICLAGGASRLGAAGAWATTTAPGYSGATGTVNGVGATSDLFYISSVIAVPGLELPSGARAYMALRPYADELFEAQRYKYVWNLAGSTFESISAGVLYTAALALAPLRHARPMRAVPSGVSALNVGSIIVISATNNVAPSAVALDGSGVESTSLGFTVSGMTPGQACNIRANAANARIILLGTELP